MASGTGPKVGRGRRLSPDERRAQILDVAARQFGALGYAAVSVGDVADEAEVARPLVYHYFGSKEQLYLAVAERFAELAVESVRTDLDLPLEQHVEHNATALLAFLDQNRDYVRGLMRFDGPSAETAAVLENLIEELIDRAMLGHLGTTDVPRGVRLSMRAYSGLAARAAREWLVFERAERDEVKELVVRALLSTLRDVAPQLAAQRSGEVARAPAGELASDDAAAAPH